MSEHLSMPPKPDRLERQIRMSNPLAMLELARQQQAKQGKQFVEETGLDIFRSGCSHTWQEVDRGHHWAHFKCLSCPIFCFTKGDHPNTKREGNL